MKKQNYAMICVNGGMEATTDINVDGGEFKINRRSEFSKLMNNPLMTTNGFTVGERNRAFLHAVLDAWIDSVEMPEDLHATDEQCARFNEKKS
jgi:hypothetical protein